MAAQLFTLPQQVRVNSSGAPYALAKAYWYRASTTTAQDVYTTSALSVAHAQPVQADAAGQFPAIWLNPAAGYDYRVIIKTSADATLDDFTIPRNKITASQLDSVTAADISFLQSGTGAVSRTIQSKERDKVSVKDFGAVGDGATDDTAAIQSAISAASASNAALYFPAGEYVCSSTLDVSNTFAVTLEGEGRAPTVHNDNTVLKFTGTSGPFINAKSTNSLTLSDLRIVYSSASFTGYLLDVSHSGAATDSSFLVVNRCHFGSYSGSLHSARGIQANKLISSVIKDSSFDSLASAIDGQDAAGSSYANSITVQGCHFADTSDSPIRYCGESWLIAGCTFEPRVSNIAGAIQSTSLTPVKNITLLGNWFGDVSSGGSTWVILFGSGASITGNRFGGTAAGAAFSLNAFSGFTASGNTFVQFGVAYSFDTTGCSNFVEYSNAYDSVTNVYGTLANQDSFSQGVNGHTILANGKLMQWGKATVTTGTPLAITFPKSFSSTNYAFIHGIYAPSGANNTAYSTSIGASGITLNVNGTAGSNVVHWHAYGDA